VVGDARTTTRSRTAAEVAGKRWTICSSVDTSGRDGAATSSSAEDSQSPGSFRLELLGIGEYKGSVIQQYRPTSRRVRYVVTAYHYAVTGEVSVVIDDDSSALLARASFHPHPHVYR